MDASQSIPDFVALAQETANSAQDNDAGRAVIEAAAVDIFSLFEARQQQHFKRGPFSRKLKALLLDAGERDLADRVHTFYLAINVLKHGKGASHRELLNSPNGLVVVASSEVEGRSLVDVTDEGFFSGLASTILEAHSFLENRG